MTTQENNITKLVNAGIISAEFPKMGGKFIINGLEFDKREYYEGRGAKYNKNINHEEVTIKITGKELAKAIRHYKMNQKVQKLRVKASTKAYSKNDRGYDYGYHQHTMTIARKRYYPELKEISRTKM